MIGFFSIKSFLFAVLTTGFLFNLFAGCTEEAISEDTERDEKVETMAEDEFELDTFAEPGDQCEIDSDCNDYIDCTIDRCINGFCINEPSDAFCDDGLECNGREKCDVLRGCIPGEIYRDCDDNDPCTMDICVEGDPGVAPHCEHAPLDRDGDGHIDIHCPGGDDCNDMSDRAYPGARELCFDTIDNDCDGKVDSLDEDCSLTNDSCSNPKEIFPGELLEWFTTGATGDIDSSCDSQTYSDVAFSFELTGRSDVMITVTGKDDFYPYVAIQSECGNNSTTIYCASNQPFMYCQKGMEPGTYYIIVSSWVEGSFEIVVEANPPSPPEEGDTCESAIDISGGGHYEGNLVCMNDDASFQCTSWAHYKDMFFKFSLDEMHDVLLRASAILFAPYVTVFRDCSNSGDAVLCDSGYPFERRIARLEPGNYIIGVESYTPGRFSLDMSLLPPSTPPENETCDEAVDVSAGGRYSGSLLAAQDDYSGTCTWRELDVFYKFTLMEPKDVHLLARGVGTFEPDIVLMRECGNPSTEIRCKNFPPAEIFLRSLPEGDYWIAVEAPYGGEFDLDVSFSPPTTACDGLDIIETSGTISGSTAGMPDDFQATCGGYATSPDKAYILRIGVPSSLIAEITSADFDTVMHLRRSCDDPASEIVCDDDGAGYPLSRINIPSLDAGDYILIVDGFGSFSSGNFTLQVTISPL